MSEERFYHLVSDHFDRQTYFAEVRKLHRWTPLHPARWCNLAHIIISFALACWVFAFGVEFVWDPLVGRLVVFRLIFDTNRLIFDWGRFVFDSTVFFDILILGLFSLESFFLLAAFAFFDVLVADFLCLELLFYLFALGRSRVVFADTNLVIILLNRGCAAFAGHGLIVSI